MRIVQSHSMEKQSDIEVRGNNLFIRYDHYQNERVDIDEQTITEWVCTEIRIHKRATRDQIIEAIIRSKYSSYGAELAAINNGGEEHTEYLNFRDFSKSLADQALQG